MDLLLAALALLGVGWLAGWAAQRASLEAAHDAGYAAGWRDGLAAMRRRLGQETESVCSMAEALRQANERFRRE